MSVYDKIFIENLHLRHIKTWRLTKIMFIRTFFVGIVLDQNFQCILKMFEYLKFNSENSEHVPTPSYERHMWAKNCGWIKYDVEAPLPDGLRTWTFAKRDDGFRLYAEDQLLLDYTYAEGLLCFSIYSN